MKQGRGGIGRAIVDTWLIGAALAACAAPRDVAQRREQPLIGGEVAPDPDPGVLLSNRGINITCSGALIAPRLVVTALHCIYDVRADASLAIDALTVSFGPARDQGAVIGVEQAEAAGGMPASLDEAVAQGRDVALLWLAADAPDEVQPLAVALDYTPRVRDAFYLTGFGLSSASGANGKRLRAAAVLSTAEPGTGILELDGAVPCYGDSGGPAVLQRRNAIVGVLGQLGVNDDAGTCGAELAFVYSVVNSDVRALLENGCAKAGGCGARSDAGVALGDGGATLGTDASAGNDAPDGGKPGAVDAGWSGAMSDAGAVGSMTAVQAAGCTCHAVAPHAPRKRLQARWALCVFGLVSLGWRRARRRYTRAPHAF